MEPELSHHDFVLQSLFLVTLQVGYYLFLHSLLKEVLNASSKQKNDELKQTKTNNSNVNNTNWLVGIVQLTSTSFQMPSTA